MGLRDFLFGRPRRGKNPARADGIDLLGRPEFWVAHYAASLGTEDEEFTEFVEPLFGVTADAAWDFEQQRLANSRLPWTHLPIPLPEGFIAEVEFADEPDYQIRFAVRHADWTEPVLLGYQSGHAALPALRWDEVVRIAACAGALPGNDRPWAPVLLLFLPSASITAEDDPKDVGRLIRRAWREWPVSRPDRIEELVDQLVANMTEPATRWRHDSELGWVNDRDISLRNPQTKMVEFNEERFLRIRQLTDMLEARRGPEP